MRVWPQPERVMFGVRWLRGLHRCACLVSRRLSGFACLEEGDKFGVNFHGCCQESGNLDDEAFFS